MLLSTIADIVGIASAARSLLGRVLSNDIDFEKLLTQFVGEAFVEQIPRFRHLCQDGEPSFLDSDFERHLREAELSVHSPESLQDELLPCLLKSISLPNATCGDDQVNPILRIVLQTALHRLWGELSSYRIPADRVILSSLAEAEGAASELTEIKEALAQLVDFAQTIDQRLYDQITDSAPPSSHKIDEESYSNPFIEARAGGFQPQLREARSTFSGFTRMGFDPATNGERVYRRCERIRKVNAAKEAYRTSHGDQA